MTTTRVLDMGGPIVHVQVIRHHAGPRRPVISDLARAVRQWLEVPAAAHRGPRKAAQR